MKAKHEKIINDIDTLAELHHLFLLNQRTGIKPNKKEISYFNKIENEIANYSKYAYFKFTTK